MDAWKQDLQKQSQDFSAEKLGSPRLADANQDKIAQDKLALGQSRLVEASPEVLTLAQQRIHRWIGQFDDIILTQKLKKAEQAVTHWLIDL